MVELLWKAIQNQMRWNGDVTDDGYNIKCDISYSERHAIGGTFTIFVSCASTHELLFGPYMYQFMKQC